MSDLDPLTLGDTPEDYIELEDGSVEIPDLEAVETESKEFYDNLAETLEERELSAIAGEFIDLIEKDREARKRRDEQYTEGIRRTGLGDDAPGGAQFDGASKVVHPVMAESCVDFASSAIKELFPPSGPVRTEFVGDLERSQLERGKRKAEFMNWQLTRQMPEYVDELEQLLSQMPLGGSQYLKLRFDEDLGRPVAEFVPIDEVFVPFAATNFYTAARVTHRQLITQTTFEKRVDSGFYRDVKLIGMNQSPEQSSAAIANDKIEGLEDTAYNEDGLRAILEVYAWRDIGDSFAEEGRRVPYIFHIDEHTEQVLAVYRNWDEEDSSFEKLDWIVEFKFIPWRGAYAIGLPHLIGGLSAALTGSLRALLDSAHINNAASMLKLKSGRVVGQNTQVDITGVTDIEAPANVDDIRKIAMPMPFNPPSPVLFQLLGFLTQAAKGVVSTSEEKIAEAGNQMPVGTAMALIEQGSKVFSAIHARLHRSQTKVLEILHRINSKWLDEQEQANKLGKVLATREDFAGSLDIIPASDPNIFSETQRFAQIQALMQMAAQDAANPAIRWDQIEIRHRLLELMHIQQPDRLLPKVEDPITSDPLTENMSALEGKLIKAEQAQDHWTHIQGHLIHVNAPWVAGNPQVNPQAVNLILSHINEHMQMLFARSIADTAQQILAMQPGVPEEQAALIAMQQVAQQLAQMLAPVLQQMQAVQQTVQQRTPPPPMDPSVQASIQIAQMDTQRKQAYDQGMLQLKQQELQLSSQQDQTKQQMEAAKLQFEQQTQAQREQFERYIAQMREDRESSSHQLQAQVELIKNEQDNHRAQVVDLLKNRDDNETKVLIEQMKNQLESMATQETSPRSEPQIDLTPQLQQLNATLDQIGKQQTNDALAEVMNGLRATIEHLGRPKMIIRDAQGKTIGVQ